LTADGIETIAADLLDRKQVNALPDAANVVFMAGRKFGSTGGEALTWAINAYAPGLVAERYSKSRIVAFSTGNIYPFVSADSGGATEDTPPGPVGEYAQSALARERVLEYFSGALGIPIVILRLNYAVELRYGVLLDIGRHVFERRPVSLVTGAVNFIWQGDANSVCLARIRIVPVSRDDLESDGTGNRLGGRRGANLRASLWRGTQLRRRRCADSASEQCLAVPSAAQVHRTYRPSG
jgi:hypothetical protein